MKFAAAGLAVVSVLIAAVITAKSLTRRDYPLGNVIAYRVVGDSAFLVWTEAQDSVSWLSRVDASGRTVWLRRLPAHVAFGDSLHIADGVVAVRYVHQDSDLHAIDQALVAFDYDGKQLWDRVLAPYTPQPIGSDARYGKTSPQLLKIAGVSVAGRFVEWVDSDTELTLTVVDARTGRVEWAQKIQAQASGAYNFDQHLVWWFRSSALDRAAPPHERLAMVHGVDMATGKAQQLIARGNGCVVGGEYMTVVDSAGTQALVAFRDGNLGVRRTIAEAFEPIGKETPYFILSCGEHEDMLIFVVEHLSDDDSRSVVVTDRSGKLVRSINVGFDLNDFLGTPPIVQTRFPQQAPVSGELTRFAPIVMEQGRGAQTAHELTMIDLATGQIAWRSPFGALVTTELFRSEGHWYWSWTGRRAGMKRTLELVVADGEKGTIAGSVQVTGLGQTAVFEQPLLPSHIDNNRIWIIPRDETRLDQPPMAVLDATNLNPIFVSARVEVSDATNEVLARVRRPQ